MDFARFLCVRAFLLTMLLFAAASAKAQPTLDNPYRGPAAPWNARFAVEAHGAGFGPVGGLGLAVEYAPSPHFALCVGAGATIIGWRAGIGVRGALPVLPRMAIGAEAWYSLGPDEDPLFAFDNFGTTSSWRVSHQVRLGLTLEYRSLSGFRFRPFLGVAVLAAESGFSCSASPCDAPQPRGRVFPYLGLALGYAGVQR